MKICSLFKYSLFFRNVYISGLTLFLALVIRLQKKILVQDRIGADIRITEPTHICICVYKHPNKTLTPAGEYQVSFWNWASAMDQNEIRTQSYLSHLVLSIRRKYIIILIHCSTGLKNNNYEKKDSKKRQQKEKRESKKGKEECTRRQICVAPLSESIIGHIGRPQHIPLPLNEYPSTLT